MRLILDGTVVRVRLDRRATSISLLVALACAPIPSPDRPLAGPRVAGTDRRLDNAAMIQETA